MPDVKDFPDKLKGSGVVRVCSYGGAFQAAQRKAYFKPFEELSGIKVMESEGPDIAKVKAMVDTGNIEYDVGEFDRASVVNLARKGDYWEDDRLLRCSTSRTSTSRSARRIRSRCCPTGRCSATAPTRSKRGDRRTIPTCGTSTSSPARARLQAGSGGLAPDLEVALMAAGVPKDKVYPIDIDKAFASLAKIKPHVDKWWTAGAQPAQLLNDNEVMMATAWNGRIYAISRTARR